MMRMILLVLVLLPTTAWAQDDLGPVVEAVVDLSPLYDALINIAAVVLSAIAGSLAIWISIKVSKLLGLKSDAVVREYVGKALQTGVVAAVNEVQKLSDRVDEVPVKNAAVAAAARYVLAHVPDGLAQLGVVDPNAPKGHRYDKLEELVRAKVDEYLANPPPPPSTPPSTQRRP